MADENTLKTIADGIVNFAPGIATALKVTGVGAPAAMAVNAIGTLGKFFGFGDNVPSEDQLHAAIQADPESAVKLAMAEMDFQLKQRDQDLQKIRIEIEDVRNARQREIDVTKTTGKKDVNLYAIAWTIISGFFILCGILMWKALPQGSNEVVFMLFGALSAGFGAVVNYFFGSSKSSSDKTKMLVKNSV